MIDTLMEQLGHRSDVQARVPDSEMATIAVVAATYVGNHQERTVQMMNGRRFQTGRIGVARFNRRLHQLADWMVWIPEVLGEMFTTGDVFIIASLPLPTCCRARPALPEGTQARLLRILRRQTGDILWMARASGLPTGWRPRALSDGASGGA